MTNMDGCQCDESLDGIGGLGDVWDSSKEILSTGSLVDSKNLGISTQTLLLTAVGLLTLFIVVGMKGKVR